MRISAEPPSRLARDDRRVTMRYDAEGRAIDVLHPLAAPARQSFCP
jgi:hypothetical protein